MTAGSEAALVKAKGKERVNSPSGADWSLTRLSKTRASAWSTASAFAPGSGVGGGFGSWAREEAHGSRRRVARKRDRRIRGEIGIRRCARMGTVLAPGWRECETIPVGAGWEKRSA